MPDSGKLLHLRTPATTDTVRIDAGFAVGDEVTSHYDPMIAKIIIQGPDRHAALQKMNNALEEYEIAGPITNIEFVKRMCVSPKFVAGEVETGYIEKNKEELFRRVEVPDEAWTQAAVGLYIAEQGLSGNESILSSQTIGFNTGLSGPRTFDLVEIPADGNSSSATSITANVQHIGPHTFSVSVGGKEALQVTSKLDHNNNILQSFYPHTRLETRIIRDPETNKLILFQQGRQYRLQLAVPKWAEKALGMKDVANSVLAPMPCKVLRVEVEEGATVTKNQALVVIESMKMETVIRAPHDGVIAKVVHKAGDLCKAGTALVEFVGEGEEKA